MEENWEALDGEDLARQVQGFVDRHLDGKFPAESLQSHLKVSDQELDRLYHEGYVDYKEDRTEKAQEIFHLLTLLNPFAVKHWLALGATEMTLEKWEEALKRLAVASLLEPEDPQPHLHAYYCYQALEDAGEAKVALEKASELAVKWPSREIEKEIETLRQQACL